MKKRSFKGLILLLACIAALTLSAVGVSATVYRKTTASVNLRSKAGSTSSDTIIATIPKGATVTLVGKSTKYSNWYYIEYNGKQGFVEGTYLTSTESTGGDDDDDDSYYTRYLTANVNLRSSAKIADGNIITTVPKGTKVKVFSEPTSGWFYVQIPSGRKGYMKGGYFSTTAPSESTTAKRTTAALNLRSSAKITSSNIILTIPRGATVYVVREASDGWYYVKYGSKYGYVKGTYLTSGSSSTTTTKKTTANVRLRSSMSTSSSSNIITVIPKGTTVTVTGTYSGWYKVSYDGQTGYVSSDYVS